MSALVLLLVAGGGRDATAGPGASEDAPAFTYKVVPGTNKIITAFPDL